MIFLYRVTCSGSDSVPLIIVLHCVSLIYWSPLSLSSLQWFIYCHSMISKTTSTQLKFITTAVQLQREPCDAAVNFDTCPILQRRRAVSLPQHDFLIHQPRFKCWNYTQYADFHGHPNGKICPLPRLLQCKTQAQLPQRNSASATQPLCYSRLTIDRAIHWTAQILFVVGLPCTTVAGHYSDGRYSDKWCRVKGD